MKRLNPITPGMRGATTVDTKGILSTDKPNKSLVKGFKRGVGRNAFGRITTPHKGGGHKRRYRMVDFMQEKHGVPAVVKSIEYDPNRSGFISLLHFADGEKRYILIPQGVKVGDKLEFGPDAAVTPGNRIQLKKAPAGTLVYNIEVKPGTGSKLVRSAGNAAEVLGHDAGYTQIRLPSSEVRKVNENAWASVGNVSNFEHGLVNLGKAGRSRHLGIRPTTRGMAQNAVDHPMGGGEGRGRGQRKHKKTKQGKIVDPGKKTRTPKKYSNVFVVSRRKTIRQK